MIQSKTVIIKITDLRLGVLDWGRSHGVLHINVSKCNINVLDNPSMNPDRLDFKTLMVG